jgi:glutamine amidotransferase
VLTDPPHGLQAQAWAPRRQRHGVVNADGFGVGWDADGDPVPARYRRAQGGPAADTDAARPAAAVGTGAGTEAGAPGASRNGRKASR